MDDTTGHLGAAIGALDSEVVYPLTNRGKLRPSNPPDGLESTILGGVNFKGFDWLRVSVWASAENLLHMLESTVLERYLPDVVGSFVDRGPVGRLTNRWTCDLRGLEVEQYDDFAGIMLKGEPCTVLGVDGVLHLLGQLDAMGVRWQTSAVHFAWDGFPIGLRETYELLFAGHVKTRSKLNPHPEGDIDRPPTPDRSGTVYTHLKPEKNKVPRYVRWYNMRGPIRCEFVAKKHYADGLVKRCVGVRSTDVGRIAIEGLRGFIDLHEPGTTRINRRPLHPLWAEFVDGAKPWTATLRHDAIEREGIEMLGPLEGVLHRAAKTLVEGMEAFGQDWLIERLRYHAGDRPSAVKVSKLRAIRSTAARKGIAGVHPWPDAYDGDAPF